MLEKLTKYLLLLSIILLINNYAISQEKKVIDYHFVYIALCQDDNTDYQKLIVELKKLNSELVDKNQDCILYFTKGMTQFSTNDLKEWVNLYPLINGNNITNLYASDEVDNILKVFSKYEFSKLKNSLLTTNKYNTVIWHTFTGKGFWQAENNKNILGILIASCGINDNFGSNFQLFICHDSNDPLPNLRTESALGKYYSFITNENTKLNEY
ncbi:MAG: hypothetical protein GZ091_13965 [Paludibacter sp.]|nr:hypothetical protein [Paludibacter sp.]